MSTDASLSYLSNFFLPILLINFLSAFTDTVTLLYLIVFSIATPIPVDIFSPIKVKFYHWRRTNIQSLPRIYPNNVQYLENRFCSLDIKLGKQPEKTLLHMNKHSFIELVGSGMLLSEFVYCLAIIFPMEVDSSCFMLDFGNTLHSLDLSAQISFSMKSVFFTKL